MLTAEHQRPLAAFFLVFAVACLIMANGLRTQVVDVLIGSGAPRQLITAIAPDMVLGQSLRNTPAKPQTTVEAPASAEGPVQPEAPAEVVTVTQSTVQAVPQRTSTAKTSGRSMTGAARPARQRGRSTTAPGVVAPAPTPAPAPALAEPEAQAIPGVRVPEVRIPRVPLSGDRSGWSPGNSQRRSGSGPSRSESVQARNDTDRRPTWGSNRGSHDSGDRSRWGSSSHHGGWNGDSGRGDRGDTRGYGHTGPTDHSQTNRGPSSWSGHDRSGHGH